MTYKIKDSDRELWVMLFLYNESEKSITDMATKGCNKMVFGFEYEDFEKLLDSMVEKKFITKGYGTDNYTLSAKGIFKLKNHVFVPFHTLSNSNSIPVAIGKLKESCDVTLLQDMQSIDYDDGSRESLIKQYGNQNLIVIFEMLPTILSIVSQFSN